MSQGCEHCIMETCEGCRIAGLLDGQEPEIEVISGFPDCPYCYSKLEMYNPTRDMKGWGCTGKNGCGTVFTSGELVEAINQNIRINNDKIRREKENGTGAE